MTGHSLKHLLEQNTYGIFMSKKQIQTYTSMLWLLFPKQGRNVRLCCLSPSLAARNFCRSLVSFSSSCSLLLNELCHPERVLPVFCDPDRLPARRECSCFLAAGGPAESIQDSFLQAGSDESIGIIWWMFMVQGFCSEVRLKFRIRKVSEMRREILRRREVTDMEWFQSIRIHILRCSR